MAKITHVQSKSHELGLRLVLDIAGIITWSILAGLTTWMWMTKMDNPGSGRTTKILPWDLETIFL